MWIVLWGGGNPLSFISSRIASYCSAVPPAISTSTATAIIPSSKIMSRLPVVLVALLYHARRVYLGGNRAPRTGAGAGVDTARKSAVANAEVERLNVAGHGARRK